MDAVFSLCKSNCEKSEIFVKKKVDTKGAKILRQKNYFPVTCFGDTKFKRKLRRPVFVLT